MSRINVSRKKVKKSNLIQLDLKILINIIKEMKGLYNENFTIPPKETGDTRRHKDPCHFSCSQIYRTKFVKMAILPKHSIFNEVINFQLHSFQN